MEGVARLPQPHASSAHWQSSVLDALKRLIANGSGLQLQDAKLLAVLTLSSALFLATDPIPGVLPGMMTNMKRK